MESRRLLGRPLSSVRALETNEAGQTYADNLIASLEEIALDFGVSAATTNFSVGLYMLSMAIFPMFVCCNECSSGPQLTVLVVVLLRKPRSTAHLLAVIHPLCRF